jgi:endonuclease/exonuclease/phosphatase family metal-dependent hydrolase
MGDLPRWKNGLIVMGDLPKNGKKEEWSCCNGDLPRWKNGLIVMGDLPKNGKKEEWSCCNG